MFETSRDAGSTPATSTIFVSSQLATASVQTALIMQYRVSLIYFLLRQPETGFVNICTTVQRKVGTASVYRRFPQTLSVLNPNDFNFLRPLLFIREIA